MKVFTKIQEYLESKEATKSPKAGIQVAHQAPKLLDPPMTKSSSKTHTMAKASDVVARFLEELREAKAEINFNIAKLKERYDA